MEKRKEFEHDYSTGLGKRFHTLQTSGEKLTAWVGRALNRVWREKELGYWRHTTGVFGAVGDALGDFEDEDADATEYQARTTRIRVAKQGRKMQFQSLTESHRPEDYGFVVTLPYFMSGIRNAGKRHNPSIRSYLDKHLLINCAVTISITFDYRMQLYITKLAVRGWLLTEPPGLSCLTATLPCWAMWNCLLWQLCIRRCPLRCSIIHRLVMCFRIELHSISHHVLPSSSCMFHRQRFIANAEQFLQ